MFTNIYMKNFIMKNRTKLSISMKSENKLVDQCTLNIQLTARIYRMKLISYGNFLFHGVILKFNRCQKQEIEKKK